MSIFHQSMDPRFRSVLPIRRVVDMQGAEYPFPANGDPSKKSQETYEPSWRASLLIGLHQNPPTDEDARNLQQDLSDIDEDFRAVPSAAVLRGLPEESGPPDFFLVTGKQATMFKYPLMNPKTAPEIYYPYLGALLSQGATATKAIQLKVQPGADGAIAKRIDLIQ